MTDDGSEAFDVCNACLIARQAADDNEEEEGIQDGDFGGLEHAIHCFQCKMDLPVAAFPPGVDPEDITICTECQEQIDHTSMQPCDGGCGAQAKVPHTGGLAYCETCRDRERR